MNASSFVSKSHAMKRNRNVNIFHKGLMIKISRITTNLIIISKKTPKYKWNCNGFIMVSFTLTGNNLQDAF